MPRPISTDKLPPTYRPYFLPRRARGVSAPSFVVLVVLAIGALTYLAGVM